MICLPRTKPVIVDDYPFISPFNKGAIAFGDTAIQIVTETHGTQLQARQALTQLRGRKVALAHHSIGTSISLEFTPLYRTRRTLTQTGRFIGGRSTGCDSIFLYCLDWTLRFGPLSMNAMDEERSWRLRKWLKRLEGLTLIGTPTVRAA